MDKFHLMTAFVAVAEEQSFAKGARRMGISAPSITRAIAELEEQLGLKLLSRTTRLVRVTDAGHRFLEDTRHILSLVEEAEAAATEVHADPRGQLTITAPVLFGKLYVLPIVTEFLERYPRMNVHTLFLDRVVNLMEEGIDVAIRIGQLPDSNMRATHLGFIRRVICATPAYFEKYGTPQEPEDLKSHRIISAQSVSPTTEWRFFQAKEPITVRLQPRLTTTTNDAAIEAALRDFGVTRLLSYQVAAHLLSGQLVTVLDTFEGEPLPIHVLHREGGRVSAKTQAFVAMITANLKASTAFSH